MHPALCGASTGCFNGATAFRWWKQALSQRQPRPPVPASMGPPPFVGGNRQVTPEGVVHVRLLQWGHRLSLVETSKASRCWGSPRAASMGPPPFVGGNPSRLSRVITRSEELQWGHRLSLVETTRGGRHGQVPGAASMGQPPFVGGNASCRPASSGHPSGFNGATAFRWWKPLRPAGGKDARTALQWGHRLSLVETPALVLC